MILLPGVEGGSNDERTTKRIRLSEDDDGRPNKRTKLCNDEPDIATLSEDDEDERPAKRIKLVEEIPTIEGPRLNSRLFDSLDRFEHVIKKDMKNLRRCLPEEGLSFAEKIILNSVVREDTPEDILELIRDILSSFSRSLQQVHFQELFLQSILPFIYGDEFEKKEVTIKRDNHIDSISPWSLIQCPRRFGKSQGTAMFVATVLRAVPSVSIILVAPSLRQCGMIKNDQILPSLFNHVLKAFPCSYTLGEITVISLRSSLMGLRGSLLCYQQLNVPHEDWVVISSF